MCAIASERPPHHSLSRNTLSKAHSVDKSSACPVHKLGRLGSECFQGLLALASSVSANPVAVIRAELREIALPVAAVVGVDLFARGVIGERGAY